MVLAALAAGLLLAVPRLRRLAADKARPKLHQILGNFKEIARSPAKLTFLGGGAVARELLIAMALSVSLRAFDDHLRLPRPDRGHQAGRDDRRRLPSPAAWAWWKQA